jgi:hypothetical protein
MDNAATAPQPRSEPTFLKATLWATLTLAASTLALAALWTQAHS